MKVGEIWTMKPEEIESIRQAFIESDGNDDDFDENVDPRVRIVSVSKDGRVEYESMDGHGSWSGVALEDFYIEYQLEQQPLPEGIPSEITNRMHVETK